MPIIIIKNIKEKENDIVSATDKYTEKDIFLSRDGEWAIAWLRKAEARLNFR